MGLIVPPQPVFDKLAEGQGLEYMQYFEFTEPARDIPAHRILGQISG